MHDGAWQRRVPRVAFAGPTGGAAATWPAGRGPAAQDTRKTKAASPGKGDAAVVLLG